MAAELIQIYYREDQKEKLYPFAIPYKNEGLTIFFENAIISQLVMASKADKIGVVSWKLKSKLRWNLGWPRLPEHITEEILNSDYDVLPFTRNTKYHKMLDAASLWHPGFRPTLTKIVEGIGKKMPGEVKKPIYQNAFSAKREIYQDYVNDYLNPAMELIKNDPEVNKLAMADSGYSLLVKKDAASPEYLQENLGVPFYPLVPFLLERLFSIYVHNKNINVTWL
jgi:hypothetical protein